MFRKAALRLTLFNAGVILAILVIAGVGAYTGVSYVLQSSTHDSLWEAAAALQESRVLREAYSDAELIGVEHRSSEEGAVAALPTLLFDDQGRLVRTVNFTFSAGDQEYEDEEDDEGAGAEAQVALLATAFSAARQEAVAKGTSLRLVIVEKHPLWVLSAPAEREGRFVGVVQSFSDVSAQEQLLGDLREILILIGVGGVIIAILGGFALSLRALAPLKQAFDRQRQFIAGASHQLRTPVAIIRADADALSRSLPGLTEENGQLLRDLTQEADFLTTVIQHLIAQARLEGAVEPDTLRAIDLVGLVRETTEAMIPLAWSRGLRLTADMDDTALLAHAEPSALRLALMALIDNAIKYNRPDGAVRVTVRGEGRWGLIGVSDDGHGIPEDERGRVFESFYRGTPARGNLSEGAGLGLAIVRQVARSCGGDAFLQSVGSDGTTVTMRLPLI